MPDVSFPITVQQAVSSAASLDELIADSTGLYWVESLADQQGRRSVLCMPDVCEPARVVDCTPEAKVRSRIHSYGGGAFAVLNGWLAWVDDISGEIWLRSAADQVAGEVRQLTKSDEHDHFGGLGLFSWDESTTPVLLAVRERAAEVENSVSELIAITLSDDRLHVLTVPEPFAAADFVACPVLHEDGMLAWTQWQQPAMAWDSSCLLVGQLGYHDGRLQLTHPQLVAGRIDAGLDGVGLQRPKWASDGQLRYLSDESGSYQVHSWRPDEKIKQLTSGDFDHDLPQWTAENLSYANLANGDLVAQRLVGGRTQLCRYPTGDVSAEILATVSAVKALTARRDEAFALLNLPDRPTEIWQLSGAHEPQVLRRAGAAPAADSVVLPRPLWTQTPRGQVHCWFYPPHPAPQNAKPAALLVVVHGGPTDMRNDAWSPATQFWTQRGTAVLEVNYSGSSGFGRTYRNRLREAWGCADVDDVLAATQDVIANERIDPAKVAIVGSSAGGFTVLSALTRSDVYAAGISKYGIADLTKLVGGPKFEARYLDGLVGPWPEAEQRYRDRSPLHRVDQITSPLLILQGSADPIVPLEQATAMTHAARDAGVHVELVVYDGEEHGFSSPEARASSLAKQAEFLGRIFALDLC